MSLAVGALALVLLLIDDDGRMAPRPPSVAPVRIGALTDSWGSTPHMAGLRDGLVALGYREREDFVIGVRFTQGQHARLPAAVRMNPGAQRRGSPLCNVRPAGPSGAARRPRFRLSSPGSKYPVGLGLVRTYAQPGGNITGVTTLTIELAAKRLELFRDLVPGLHRVLISHATHAPSVGLAHSIRNPVRWTPWNASLWPGVGVEKPVPANYIELSRRMAGYSALIQRHIPCASEAHVSTWDMGIC